MRPSFLQTVPGVPVLGENLRTSFYLMVVIYFLGILSWNKLE